MNPASWILLAIVLVLFALALIHCIRRRGRCSCGECGGCERCGGKKSCAACRKENRFKKRAKEPKQ